METDYVHQKMMYLMCIYIYRDSSRCADVQIEWMISMAQQPAWFSTVHVSRGCLRHPCWLTSSRVVVPKILRILVIQLEIPF